MPESPPRSLTEHAPTRPASFHERYAVLALAIITLAGLALRLHLLGELSLTLDEADSAFWASVSWRQFLTAIHYGEQTMTMVMFFVFLRGWIHLGDSELALRCLPVLFGVATVPAVYQLGNRFFSKNVGLAAAALLAAHSYHLRYSQQLRSYSMALFFLVLSTYFFLSAVESPKLKRLWTAYVIFSVLAIYSHLFSLLVLAAQWLSPTPSTLRRIGPLRLFWIAASAGVLALPAASQVLLCSHCGEGFEWIPRPTTDAVLLSMQNLAGSYTWSAHHTAGGHVFLAVYAGLWILAFPGVASAWKANSPASTGTVAVRVATLWLIFPLLVMLAFPLLNPFSRPKYFFHPHYTILCLPAATLLAALGIATLSRMSPNRNWIFGVALFCALGLSAVGDAEYYAGLSAYSPDHDWRPVTRYILARQQPGDGALFPNRGYRPYLYYVHRERSSQSSADAPPVAFPVNVADELANYYLRPEKIDQATHPFHRIWLVFSLEDPYDVRMSALIQSTLERHFHLAGEQNFPQQGVPDLRIALFVKDPEPQVERSGE